jgi:uncharacterized pyridoxal phosphate-containing UPF0001 family protein
LRAIAIDAIADTEMQAADRIDPSLIEQFSEKLARRLDQTGRALEVMIEVKLSEEDAKAGAAPETVPGLVEAIRAYPNLRLTGLMTMPPWSDKPEQTRPYFRRLAALGRTCGLSKLSMGMSNDFEAAIEEGATHIRVGTALFGPRKKDG